MTSASPVITVSPAWLTHSQSSTTECVSACFSRTVTRTVTVSPGSTGRKNLQRLVAIDRARARQFGAEHRRDQRAAPHTVRDHVVEAVGFGEFGIDMGRD